MNNDKELLELAAKAMYGEFAQQMIDGGFSPLTDDGDALRLAVNLGMIVDVRYRSAETQKHNRINYWLKFPSMEAYETIHFDDLELDPYAATRRAIVRAAAEIGKDMK